MDADHEHGAESGTASTSSVPYAPPSSARRRDRKAGTSQYSSDSSFARQFRDWWYGQKVFARQRDLAAALGVALITPKGWLAGRAFPSEQYCVKLYSITGLDCFGPGRAEARAEHLRSKPPRQLSAGVREKSRVRSRKWWEEHSEQVKANARAGHIAQQPRINTEELERLRQPENRLEALRYGSEKLSVCLGCGWIGPNLSRHVSACPADPRPSPSYKDRWEYNKTTALMSPEQRRKASEVKKASPRFKEAQQRNRDRTLELFAACRRRQSEAKQRGESLRRGPMRAEARTRHRGRRGARPHRQKVPDAKVAEILRLDLPIGEGARRAGLSQTAFYRRAQRLGWSAEASKGKRRIINKYIFMLRSWCQAQKKIPTAEQIVQRHIAGLRAGEDDLFRQFDGFFSHLEAEVKTRLWFMRKLVQRKNSSAVITLASRVFMRARSAAQGGSTPAEEVTHGTACQPSAGGLPPLGRKQQDLSGYFAKANLTPKQRQCASLMWEYGLGIRKIARQLGIHPTTVEEHLRLAKRKISRSSSPRQSISTGARDEGEAE